MASKRGLVAVIIAVSVFYGLPADDAAAAHVFSHGMSSEPTQEQINEFCDKRYREISQSAQYSAQQKREAETLYKRYCGKPFAKPSKPEHAEEPEQAPQTRQGRIDEVQPPACLGPGSEIHVRGKNLRDGGLNCRLETGGRARPLQAYSRTAQEFRFRLNDPQPAPAYVLQCDVNGDRERINLQGCAQPGTADVDLAAGIEAGVLRPGRTQTVGVAIPNRGSSRTPRSERYRVLLSLVDRDLTRTMATAVKGRDTLVRKYQWATRVPAGGNEERISMVMNIPAQLPDSRELYWCAFVDSDRRISEIDERNNLNCVPASGARQTVARDDLSGVFGSAVRRTGPARVPSDGVPDNPPRGGLETRQYVMDESFLPQLAIDIDPRDLRVSSRNGQLPQENRNVREALAETLRDTVRIRVSGVLPKTARPPWPDNWEVNGASVVASGKVFLGSPRFIILVTHGPLSMNGVVPGETDGYEYYLYIYDGDTRPSGCAVDPDTGAPIPGGWAPKEIRNPGLLLSGGPLYTGAMRDVEVDLPGSGIERYYVKLCVVGTELDTHRYAAVSSNAVKVEIIDDYWD